MKRIMKLAIFLSSIVFYTNLYSQEISQLTAQCAASAGDNATYLKDFVVTLDAGTPGGAPPQARYALLMNKNSKYRLTICNAPQSDGEAVLQLFDMNKLLGSTFIEATGKDFPSFDFNCTKTGVYHIFVSFKEGKSGEAVAILSYIGRL